MLALLTSKTGIASMVALLAGLIIGYQAGSWVSYRSGVNDQKVEQALADVKARRVNERIIRDAIGEAGLAATDADVDAILRGLTGE